MSAPDLYREPPDGSARGGPGDSPSSPVPPTRGTFAARLADVRVRIAAAARRAGRDGADVLLVAVSKLIDPAVVAAAARAGQRDFGESRAQELLTKIGTVGIDVRWHFVGRVQRNKVADIVGRVSLVHSVDRIELADALAARARREGVDQRVLVQVNVPSDPAKAGCHPAGVPDLVAHLDRLDGITCVGLMTVPPLDTDPRPVFRALRTIGDDVASTFPQVSHLSMGMSNDFEVAVEEGATIVRVGEALFGARPVPPI